MNGFIATVTLFVFSCTFEPVYLIASGLFSIACEIERLKKNRTKVGGI